jgi:hypothetical protein
LRAASPRPPCRLWLLLSVGGVRNLSVGVGIDLIRGLELDVSGLVGGLIVGWGRSDLVN